MRNFNLRKHGIRVLPMLLLCVGLTTEAEASKDGPKTKGYIDDRALKVNGSFSIGVSGYFEGTGLSYSVNDPSVVTTSISGSTLTVSASSKTGWSSKILVTATDSSNRTATQDFTVYVYSTSPADVNLSVSKSTISEGAGRTTVTVTAAFTHSWHFADSQTVTLSVSHSGGVGATWSTPSSITIPAGATSATTTFTVTPTNDCYHTSDGKVTVSGSATETGMDVNGAIVALSNNDAAPVVNLSVSKSSISEGAGATSVTVTATTNGTCFSTAKTVSISAAVSGGVGASVSTTDLTIPKGATSATATITVTPTNDCYDTSNGKVTVSGSLTGVTVNDASDITLSNNNAAPVVNLSVSKSSISEGAGATSVTVTATTNGTCFSTAKTVSISAAVSGGVGASVSTTDLTIPKGATSATATITVTPTNDCYDTSNGKVTVSGSLTGVTVNDASDITLSNNNAAPVVNLSVSKSSISEGAGATSVTVTATTNGTCFSTAKTVSISAAVSGGVGASVSTTDLTIPKGATSATATITVTPTNDCYDTSNGKVTVSGSLTGVTVNDASDITLSDNDAAPVVNLSVSKSSISEGAGATSVTVTATTNGTCFSTAKTVSISAAVSGGVGASVSTTDLTIPKGATSATATITVTPTNDCYDTSNGKVTVSGSLTGVTVNDASDITLSNNNAAPVVNLSVSKSSISEGAGATSVTVTATTNGTCFSTAKTVSISAAVSGGVGASVSTTDLTIPKGATSATATITVTPTNDCYGTSDGKVTVSGSLTGVTVNDASDITLSDNDAAPALMTLSVSKSSISEGAGATSVTVTATTNGTCFSTAKTVSISAAVSGGVGASVSTTDLTIPKGAASATATITVTPTNDNYDTSNGKVTVSGSLGGVTKTATVTLTDNDATPALILSASTSTISEGAGATSVTVTARHQNATRFQTGKTVKIRASVSGGVGATVSTPVNLSFPKDATSATASFTVTPTNDDIDRSNGKVTVTGNLAGITVTSTTIALINDDTREVKVSPSALEVSENEGTGTYDVTLGTRPTATVTVSVSSNATSAATVDKSTLTFTTSNWSTAQRVTVTGVNDDLDNAGDSRSATISNAASGGDYGSESASVSVTVKDDDTRGVTVSSSTLEVAENGGTGTYDVTLGTKPTATVTVSVSSNATTAATVDKSTLTFTTSNWSTAQRVTVTGVNDDLDNAGDSRSATISNAASGGDYGSESASVSVTVKDDDTRGVSVSSSTLEVAENSGTGTYDVTLGTKPTATVTVSVSSSATSAATVDKSTLTFTTSNWSTAQTVTVTGVNDDLDNAGDSRSATISNAASGGDYGSESASVSVTVKDDDTRGVSVSSSTLEVSENGGTGTYDVTLGTKPTATVTVSVTSNATSAATVDKSSLTFTTSNWSTAQTVTVTGVNDDLDNAGDSRSATISNAASGGDYGSESASVSVTVKDDDTSPSGITLSATPTTISEGAGATTVTVTATVANGTRYALAQTVTVAVAGTGESTRVGFTAAPDTVAVTIAAGAASSSATFTLTPDSDTRDEVDETVTLSGTAAPSGAAVTPATITLTDDDVPSITIAAVADTVTEGTAVAYTIKASPAPVVALTVNLGVSGGAGFLSGAAPTTATVAAGADSTSLSLATTNDSVDEPTGAVTVTLKSGTGYAVGTPGSAKVTIEDDDTSPSGITLSAAPATISESAGATTVTVTATVANGTRYALAQTVTVAVAGTGESTRVGFTAAPDTVAVTIAAGAASSSATFTLTPDSDTRDEVDETVTLSGTAAPSGAAVTPATITLTDDDVPSITIAAVADTVTEGTAVAYTIKASPAPVVALTVNLGVSGGAGFLSGAAPTTATVAAGADSTSLSLATTNDSVDEPTGAVTVTLKSGTGYAVGTPGSAKVTIEDDDTTSQAPTDPPGSLAATPGDSLLALDWSAVARASGYELRYKAENAQNPATWTWKNIGAGTSHTISGLDNGTKYVVQLRGVNTSGKGPRTRVTGTPVANAVPTVSISADGAAVTEGAAAAFTIRASSVPSTALVVRMKVSGASGFLSGALPDSVIIAAGKVTGSLSLATVDDAVDEAAGAVTVTLKAGAGYKLSASNTARVTVNDDDAAPTGITLSVSPSTIAEAAGATSVTVTARPAGGTRFALAQTVTVTAAGSGNPNRVGFAAAPDTLAVTIAAGAQSGSGNLTVTPANDAVNEDDETVTFTGSAAPSGASVSSAALTLTDDDAPVITISAVSDTVTEGTEAAFTLTASLAPANALTVNLEVTGGGGFLGGSTPTTAAISAGSTTGTLSLATVDDKVEEADDTVEVRLKTGSGYTVGAADSATVVIEDDEPKTPPSAAPGNLAATPGDRLLVLGWSAVARASGYELRYKAENAQNPATWTWKNIGVGTSHTISGLDNGTTYIVQLRGVNKAGKGPRSRITGTPASGAVPAITISAAADRVTEGTAAAFTLRASSVSSSALTVRVAVSGALGFLSGAAPNTVVIAAGTASAAMSLGTTNDMVDEPSAALTAVVKAGAGYTVGAADTAAVTIEDDDTAPTGIALSVSPSTISEGAGATKVTVTASPTGGTRFALAQTVAVAVAGSGNAKTVGYAASRTSFNLTIAAGAGSAGDTLMVTPVNDGANTDDETITVSGSALPSSAVVAPATIALTDDDVPVITIAAVSDRVSEGASAAFTLTATPAPARALTVGLSGSDPGGYLSGAAPTAATIAAGSATGSLSLATVDDKVDEPNARVTVAVLPGAGYTVGAADTAWVTIEDDEPTVAPTASPGNFTATPGNGLLVLDWSPVARAFSYELRYKEENAQNPATWTWQNTGAGTSHTISNLVNGRKYIVHAPGRQPGRQGA